MIYIITVNKCIIDPQNNQQNCILFTKERHHFDSIVAKTQHIFSDKHNNLNKPRHNWKFCHMVQLSIEIDALRDSQLSENYRNTDVPLKIY